MLSPTTAQLAIRLSMNRHPTRNLALPTEVEEVEDPNESRFNEEQERDSASPLPDFFQKGGEDFVHPRVIPQNRVQVELEIETMSAIGGHVMFKSWYLILIVAIILQVIVDLQWDCINVCNDAEHCGLIIEEKIWSSKSCFKNYSSEDKMSLIWYTNHTKPIDYTRFYRIMFSFPKPLNLSDKVETINLSYTINFSDTDVKNNASLVCYKERCEWVIVEVARAVDKINFLEVSLDRPDLWNNSTLENTSVSYLFQKKDYTLAALVLRYVLIAISLAFLVRFVARKRHASTLHEQNWILVLHLGLFFYLNPFNAATVFSNEGFSTENFFHFFEEHFPVYFLAVLIAFMYSLITASMKWDSDMYHPPVLTKVIPFIFIFIVIFLDVFEHYCWAICSENTCNDPTRFTLFGILGFGVLLCALWLYWLHNNLGKKPYLESRPQQLAARLFIYLFAVFFLYLIAIFIILYIISIKINLGLASLIAFKPLQHISPLLVFTTFAINMTHAYTNVAKSDKIPIRPCDPRWKRVYWPKGWYKWLSYHGGSMYTFASEEEEALFYYIQMKHEYVLEQRHQATRTRHKPSTGSSPNGSHNDARDNDVGTVRAGAKGHAETSLSQPLLLTSKGMDYNTSNYSGQPRSDAKKDGFIIIPRFEELIQMYRQQDRLMMEAERRRRIELGETSSDDPTNSDNSDDDSYENMRLGSPIDADGTLLQQSLFIDSTPETPRSYYTGSRAVTMPTSPTSTHLGGVPFHQTFRPASLRTSTASGFNDYGSQLLRSTMQDQQMAKTLRDHGHTQFSARFPSSACGAETTRTSLLTSHPKRGTTNRTPIINITRLVRRLVRNAFINVPATLVDKIEGTLTYFTSLAFHLQSKPFFNLETAIDLFNLSWESYSTLTEVRDNGIIVGLSRNNENVSEALEDVEDSNTTDHSGGQGRFEHELYNASVRRNKLLEQRVSRMTAPWYQRLFRCLARCFCWCCRSSDDDDFSDDDYNDAPRSSREKVLQSSSIALEATSFQDDVKQPPEDRKSDGVGADHESFSVKVENDSIASSMSESQPPSSEASVEKQAIPINVERFGYELLDVFEELEVQVIIARMNTFRGRQHNGKRGRIVIAFRGTDNLSNAKYDLKVGKVPWEEMRVPYRPGERSIRKTPSSGNAYKTFTPAGARNSDDKQKHKRTGSRLLDMIPGSKVAYVHKGFIELWSALRGPVLRRVNAIIAQRPSHAPPIGFYITGHSLGGALAVLCAYTLRRAFPLSMLPAPVVYTFGMPSIGNKTFADEYNRAVPDTFRVVNENDAVVSIASSWWVSWWVTSSAHVGIECSVDRNGNFIADPMFIERTFRPTRGKSIGIIAHSMLNYGKSLDSLAQSHSFGPCPARPFIATMSEDDATVLVSKRKFYRENLFSGSSDLNTEALERLYACT